MKKRTCKKCKKVFFTYDAWIRKGGGKYCSRECASIGTWKFTDSPGYGTLHHWIAKQYGRANECEMKNCSGKSKTYDWALRNGFKYEWNIKNYIKLCRSCHKKYDFIKTRLNVRERFLQRKPLDLISKTI